MEVTTKETYFAIITTYLVSLEKIIKQDTICLALKRLKMTVNKFRNFVQITANFHSLYHSLKFHRAFLTNYFSIKIKKFSTVVHKINKF
jgi:hypothetical protein